MSNFPPTSARNFPQTQSLQSPSSPKSTQSVGSSSSLPSLTSSFHETSLSDIVPEYVIYQNITLAHIPAEYSLSLPETTDPTSIVVRQLSGADKPFIYDPVMPTLFGEAEVEVVKGENSWTGRVVNNDSNSITIAVKAENLSGQRSLSRISEPVRWSQKNSDYREHNVTIAKYDTITGLSSHARYPSLHFDGEAVVTYLFSGPKWEAIGTIILGDETNSSQLLSLRVAAHISYDPKQGPVPIGGNIALIAGDVPISSPEQFNERAPRAMFAMASPMSRSISVTTSLAEDYHRYQLPRQALAPYTVITLDEETYPYIKIYMYHAGETDESSTGVATFGYRFTPTRQMPAMRTHVYSFNDKDGAFLGTVNIPETAEGKETDVLLGSSSLITVKSTIDIVSDKITSEVDIAKYNVDLTKEEGAEGRSWHIITERLKVTVSYFNETAASLLVRMSPRGTIYLSTSCGIQKRISQTELEFTLPLTVGMAPGMFTCDVISARYY